MRGANCAGGISDIWIGVSAFTLRVVDVIGAVRKTDAGAVTDAGACPLFDSGADCFMS